jgi:hypothetical protein
MLTVALSWALAGLMHWWPRLSSRWRLRLSILTCAAGIGFLVAGLQSEGLREAATTSLVVLGPATLTETASASASLYYYVLTLVCLILGFAGLVFGEPLARLLREQWLWSAASVAWLVTAMRVLLEKSAAPAVLTNAVGVTWMAPVAGAFFAACLRDEGRGGRALVRPLWTYAYLVRLPVAAIGVVATALHLGTHYDVSPIVRVGLALTGRDYAFVSGSLVQVLWLVVVPQLVVWPLYTVAAGLLGGAVFLRLVGLLPPAPRRRVPVEAPSDPTPFRGEG